MTRWPQASDRLARNFYSAVRRPRGARFAADLNDYPTSTRADYVFGCMKANGDTRQSLEQCSCSIDVIATILPYDKYVAAETVASITQQAGQIGGMLRNSAFAQDALNDLRRAQAEAQVAGVFEELLYSWEGNIVPVKAFFPRHHAWSAVGGLRCFYTVRNSFSP